MDEEIRAFLKRRGEETDAWLEAWSKGDPNLCLERLSTPMWFAGLKKYGSEWVLREYELRNLEKNKK